MSLKEQFLKKYHNYLNKITNLKTQINDFETTDDTYILHIKNLIKKLNQIEKRVKKFGSDSDSDDSDSDSDSDDSDSDDSTTEEIYESKLKIINKICFYPIGLIQRYFFAMQQNDKNEMDDLICYNLEFFCFLDLPVREEDEKQQN